MADAYSMTTGKMRRIEEVFRERIALEEHKRKVPTDTQLGAELGLSARTIQWHMKMFRERERMRQCGNAEAATPEPMLSAEQG